jgi:hypothetical protein
MIIAISLEGLSSFCCRPLLLACAAKVTTSPLIKEEKLKFTNVTLSDSFFVNETIAFIFLIFRFLPLFERGHKRDYSRCKTATYERRKRTVAKDRHQISKPKEGAQRTNQIFVVKQAK